ncbi:MAG TPA: ribosome biogenesis GTPase Der [Casimicrobiaceae bacterium]|jgi:GTP-binding protein|nr:ribosome biogenesis GTPase Der [Casimicrobiaceae bacterium]
MLPTLVLVGRPNVGKSTLFNRLTASRAALVADYPGLTRDRHYGRGRWGERPYLVVDTGGFEPKASSGIMQAMAEQTKTAIAEADAIVFLVDGRAGLTGEDRTIADVLRRSGRPLLLAVNKSEGLAPERASAEFHELGLGEPLPISAAHNEHVRELVEQALALCPPASAFDAEPAAEEAKPIKVAIVGRPNVGKSTLVNTLLGEERVITFDEPGTTRDSIYLDFERGGRGYTLIDTAGVRRRGKVTETIEKFSVIKTLQAIDDANVVVLLLDAAQGISEQDAHLAGAILEAGRALVVALNKWDAVDADARSQAMRELERKLGFLTFAELHPISAKHDKGVGPLIAAIDRAYAAAMARLPTPKLTRALQAALARQEPPRAGLVRPKLRYAHQGGANPPLIVIHGSALGSIPDAYRRYLEHFFREAFKLQGTPLRIQFKTGANPYAEAATHRRRRR